MNAWQFLCGYWQVVCGEDGRGEEVAQCGSTAVLMTVSKQDQEGFIKVKAVSCYVGFFGVFFFLVSHDSWFHCSILFSSLPFQTSNFVFLTLLAGK